MIKCYATHTETEQTYWVQTNPDLSFTAIPIKNGMTVKTPVVLPKTKNYYEHYKGNLYNVYGIARDNTTGNRLIIYADMKNDVWARPENMFFGIVLYEGKNVERFKKMEVG